jgi:hypothetical protein
MDSQGPSRLRRVFLWYRIRVHVAAQPGEKLALAGPSDTDDV